MKSVVFIRTAEIYNDSRATKEIKTLLDAGFFVFVLGWNRNGKAIEQSQKLFYQYKNIELNFFDEPVPNGLGMKNIGKLLKWRRWVIKKIKRIHNIDFVHSCDLDTGFCIYSYCKKNKIKIVYDIYDYYVDTHRIPRYLKNIVEHFEIKIINHAFLTIICTEERKQQIAKAHPSKLIVVYNTPDINIENVNMVNKYDYVYCGQLRDKRLIEEILNKYQEHSDLKFAFAGHGIFSDYARQLAKEYKNFDFFDSIPYDDVLSLESSSLCISAIYDPSIRNHQLCAPNKFYEALALGKPQIVCKGTGIDKVVEENNIGFVINYDANDFYKAIDWMKAHSDECIEMSNRARKIYNEKYKWSYMADILIEGYYETKINN